MRRFCFLFYTEQVDVEHLRDLSAREPLPLSPVKFCFSYTVVFASTKVQQHTQYSVV